ncbi:hypothetical protein [Corynebacterium sp. ACRPQ]|uniref:hypothetical protein n=1 Tax=Corynebacterium sp. ACRPQ TaxID=2918201 RepID=UPI001EF39A50|nr:hypothetical protein [Corynebacterium sp. ACRPQ]MCG7442289.1 hypothetical protein [Corynebacterium sp. ACRPQ]
MKLRLQAARFNTLSPNSHRAVRKFATLISAGLLVTSVSACSKEEKADDPVFNPSSAPAQSSAQEVTSSESPENKEPETLADLESTPEGKLVSRFQETGDIQEGDWCTPEVMDAGGNRTFLDLESGEIFDEQINEDALEEKCMVALTLDKKEGIAYIAAEAYRAEAWTHTSLDYIHDLLKREYGDVNVDKVIKKIEFTDKLEGSDMANDRLHFAQMLYKQGMHPDKFDEVSGTDMTKFLKPENISPNEYRDELEKAEVDWDDFALYVLLKIVDKSSSPWDNEAIQEVEGEPKSSKPDLLEALEVSGFSSSEAKNAVERMQEIPMAQGVDEETYDKLLPKGWQNNEL